MLHKNIKLNDIVVVRTSSGEVIGKVAKDQTIKNIAHLRLPLIVQPVQDNKGNLNISFFPYSLTAMDDEIFEVEGDVFKPRKEISDIYVRQTSSLELPAESGIILPR